MKSKFKQDREFEFVGISENPEWAIRLLTGEFKEVIVRYDDIKIESLDETDKESDLTLSFGYTILNDTVLPDDYDEEALGQYIGDLLMMAIQNGMEDGTAVLNEREPE
ncbi:hypothetical protein OAA38_00280 [bacterium]|nr:hypothetical protein [bacterium]